VESKSGGAFFGGATTPSDARPVEYDDCGCDVGCPSGMARFKASPPSADVNE
jgi:hypothetical protein